VGRSQDERTRHRLYYARTRDGWRIALHRYRPTGGATYREPVFLCHGLGSNRFDLDAPGTSLARYLSRAGFDSWVVELRGGGASSRPRFYNRLRFNWNFDDYLYHDLPAALALIHKVTRESKVHWVGHSMGGMLAYAYLAVWNDTSIRSVVTAGSPAFSTIERPLLDWVVGMRILARPINRIPNRILGRLASYAPGLALNSIGHLLCNPRNMDPRAVKRFLRQSLEDIPVSLVEQFASWYRNKAFRLSYGTFDYREALRHIRVPVLVVAGARDWLVPPHDLRSVFEQLGSRDKHFFLAGKDAGLKENYGHVDLILGTRALSEIFPRILHWLDERSQGRNRMRRAG
jgi:pimeloyl-ACP methyl ester carboxylesterase